MFSYSGEYMIPVLVLSAVFALLFMYGMICFAYAGWYLRVARKSLPPIRLFDTNAALASIFEAGGTKVRKLLIHGIVASVLAFMSITGIFLYVLVLIALRQPHS